MSVESSLTLWCDRCRDFFYEGVSTDTAKILRDLAKTFGWITIREDGKRVDVCNRCKKKEAPSPKD